MIWGVVGVLSMLVFTFAVPLGLIWVAADLDGKYPLRVRIAAGIGAPLGFAFSFVPVFYCFGKADNLHCPPNMVQMHYQTGPRSGIDYCTPAGNQ